MKWDHAAEHNNMETRALSRSRCLSVSLSSSLSFSSYENVAFTRSMDWFSRDDDGGEILKLIIKLKLKLY